MEKAVRGLRRANVNSLNSMSILDVLSIPTAVNSQQTGGLPFDPDPR